MKKIRSALISVYHKEGLLPILAAMKRLNISLYSTGGTCDYIRSEGYDVIPVEDLTGFPSIFGGRVKTLHPAVMGGILFRRDDKNDLNECKQYSIPPIDLVVVDLYPFLETVRLGKSEKDIIEKIDIGGISLIRAAAKNFRDVVIIPDRSAYGTLQQILENGGVAGLVERQSLAALAFDISSDYDSNICNYFNREADTPSLKISSRDFKVLRYGENPHQKGVFYGRLEEMLEQLHGKEISYNNLLDIDAAIKLMSEFSETTLAILKHNNACGISSRNTLAEAWDASLAADPLSAFGGIIVANRSIDKATAEKINEIFFEVIIAPGYQDDAYPILASKKNRIILKIREASDFTKPLKSVLNGYLKQDPDNATESAEELKVVTTRRPDERELEDLVFANKIVKHTKSNAIVLVHNRQLIGSGTGQTSRIDAMKQAIEKARLFNLPLQGAVIASDAFFPFPDNVEVAYQAGIRAIVQPGGSVRDQDSIDFCNKHDISMAFTGIRHFKH